MLYVFIHLYQVFFFLNIDVGISGCRDMQY